MKLKLTAILAFLFLLPIPSVAVSQSAALSWTAPTTRTDTTPITGALTYNIYAGPKGNETIAFTGVIGTSFTDSTAVPVGQQRCWYVTAVETPVGQVGVEGAASNEACKTYFAAPNVPTALVVK